MFVIGIDSHKDTLAACLVDHLGTPLEYRNISNTPAGHPTGRLGTDPECGQDGD